jgi:hypothetical protein
MRDRLQGLEGVELLRKPLDDKAFVRAVAELIEGATH